VLLANSRLSGDKPNPSTIDNEAIRLSSRNGYLDVVKVLLADPRVNPYVYDNYAIYWASQNGHKDVVNSLTPRLTQSSSIESLRKFRQ